MAGTLEDGDGDVALLEPSPLNVPSLAPLVPLSEPAPETCAAGALGEA